MSARGPRGVVFHPCPWSQARFLEEVVSKLKHKGHKYRMIFKTFIFTIIIIGIVKITYIY